MIKKYYEKQLVNDVQKLDTTQTEPTREQINTERRVQRKFKQSGLETADIITSKRVSKPANRLTL